MGIVHWTHISDIHYCTKYAMKLESIFPSLLSTLENRKQLTNDRNLMADEGFLFVTGDLSYNGTEKELDRAYKDIIKPIASKLSLKSPNIFLCPGNHEIVRKKAVSGNIKLDDSTIPAIFVENARLYKTILAALSPYKKFHSKVFPKRKLLHPGLFYVENFASFNLSVIGLNTAWAANGGEEDKGKLFIGLMQLVESLRLASSQNEIIFLSHHPIPLLNVGDFSNTNDTYNCLSKIRNRASFLFSGHIHSPSGLNVGDSSHSIAISSAGAFFVDETHPNRPLSFSVGWIDTVRKFQKSYVFIYYPNEEKWLLASNTSKSKYKIATRIVSIKDSRRLRKSRQKTFKSYPAIRNRDFELLERSISRFKDGLRAIWIIGLPGVGKTTFSFGLSNVLFHGSKPVHIERGFENDLNEIGRAIRNHSPQVWFEAWRKYGKRPEDNLTPNEILDIIAEILRKSNLWFIVEAGEDCTETVKPNLCRFLNTTINSSTEIRIVITTRVRPIGLPQPPHLIYELDVFSFDDVFHFARLFIKSSKPFVQQIHDRFHGHPLAINAFLSQINKKTLTSDDEKHFLNILQNIPIETSHLLETIWKKLSEKGKGILKAISEFPEIGIPIVVEMAENRELERSGILSVYPSALPHGPRFYVHPLVTEVCCSLLNEDQTSQVEFDILNSISSNNEFLNFGPLLMRTAIESHNIPECLQWLESHGRAWIEVAGIDAMSKSIEALLRFVDHLPLPSYLRGLCYLFNGEYQNADQTFRDILSMRSISDSLVMGVRAELMECARRRGRIFDVFGELIELLPKWYKSPIPESGQDKHFSGVCGFLLAQQLRSLAVYDKANEIYARAEEFFGGSQNPSDLVEKMHCQYTRTLTQLISGVIEQADLRTDFQEQSIRSDFLFGLASYLYGAAQIRKRYFSEAISALSLALSHFQKFRSVSYSSRMLSMLGVCCLFQREFSKAHHYFSEVLKFSDKNSPQFNISNGLLSIISSNGDAQFTTFIGSFENLLGQGKLATAATLMSASLFVSEKVKEIMSKSINSTVYVLEASQERLKPVRIHLPTVEDAIKMLKERLGLAKIEDSFPVVE